MNEHQENIKSASKVIFENAEKMFEEGLMSERDFREICVSLDSIAVAKGCKQKDYPGYKFNKELVK